MAKLNIDWTELADASVTTGATGTTEIRDMSTATGMLHASERQAEKPILVYLTSREEKYSTEQDVVENTTLRDERVAIGSKLFTMVKANGDAIDSNHPYYNHLAGRTLPRFVAFTSDGEQIGKIEGRASPSKLFKLMKKAATRDYVVNLDKTVKDFQKLLTELDKLDVLRQAVAQKEQSAQTSRDKKEIEKKRDQIAKDEEELREAEEKLFDVKRRKKAA